MTCRRCNKQIISNSTHNCKVDGDYLNMVQVIIASHLKINVSEITPEKTLAELGADSFDVIELSFKFEDHFDIEIPDCDAAQLKKVSDLVEYFDRRVKN